MKGYIRDIDAMLRWTYVTGCLKITVHVFYPGTSYLCLMSNAWIHGGWVAVFDWFYDVKMTAAKQSTTQRILTIILI